MSQGKRKPEAKLQELISNAKEKNIEIRMEKLLREIGYRAHSGRCKVRGRDLIVLDRDASVHDQIEFLTSALADLEAAENRGSRNAEPNSQP
jgi:predicted site-specific integrase-resolvase